MANRRRLSELKPSDVIATREYQLVTKAGKKRKVVVRFSKAYPAPDGVGAEAYCLFQIDGLEPPEDLPRTQFMPGVDGVQALFGAMQMAWTILFASQAYRDGRLRFWGLPVLGLPPLVFAFPGDSSPPPRPRSRRR